MANTIFVPQTLKVGLLIGNGFNGAEVLATVKAFMKAGIIAVIVSEKLGTVRSEDNYQVNVDETFLTTARFYSIHCM